MPEPEGLGGDPFGTEDIALFDSLALALASPLRQAPAGPATSPDGRPTSPLAGLDIGQAPSAAPDAGATDRAGGGSPTALPLAAANSQAGASFAALVLGAGRGTTAQAISVPARGGAAGGAGGAAGPSGPSGALGPGGRRHDNQAGDPLWVLDANNYTVLADGGTGHDFAAWNVDLYAQVSGATVASNGPVPLLDTRSLTNEWGRRGRSFRSWII